MRVLLDECVARQLKGDFAVFDVRTVQEMGWAGIKNGALIAVAAESGFEAIFTVDRDFGLQYRDALPVAVVVLEVGTTDPVKLRPYLPSVIDALRQVQLGERIRVGA
jgi:hypothetical protein